MPLTFGPFRSVLVAMMDQLRFGTANIGGHYDSSRRAEQAVTDARHNMAQFLNCDAQETLGFLRSGVLLEVIVTS